MKESSRDDRHNICYIQTWMQRFLLPWASLPSLSLYLYYSVKQPLNSHSVINVHVVHLTLSTKLLSSIPMCMPCVHAVCFVLVSQTVPVAVGFAEVDSASVLLVKPLKHDSLENEDGMRRLKGIREIEWPTFLCMKNPPQVSGETTTRTYSERTVVLVFLHLSLYSCIHVFTLSCCFPVLYAVCKWCCLVVVVVNPSVSSIVIAMCVSMLCTI